MVVQLLALAGSFSTAVLLTPLCRRLSIRFGIVDSPDALRKLHREPVALCGGPVVLLSTLLAACMALVFIPSVWQTATSQFVPIAALLISCIGIVVLGMVDDRFGLRGRQKLFGQVIITSILVASGYQFGSVSVFGWTIPVGYLTVPISIAWLLLTINSINLIDGADGLCCSVGWIASAGFAAMASLQGHWIEATFAATISGSLLGFLVFNFPPAKVFLGDSGSMLVGLVLGALAIRTSLKGPTAVSILGAVAILALPFFDSSMAIVRRKLTGRSIFSTDRGHLHHNLITKGYGHSRLVILISLFSCILATGAFLSAALNNELLALIAVIVVLGCLVASRLFGYAELRLLAGRVAHFGNTLLPQFRRDEAKRPKMQYRLQGDRCWETVWDSMVEFADKHDLSKVCLDLNVPWLHEGYHASWNRDRMPDDSNRWKMVVPVFSSESPLGRLEFIGPMTAANAAVVLESLVTFVECIQSDICRICDQHELDAVHSASPIPTFVSGIVPRGELAAGPAA